MPVQKWMKSKLRRLMPMAVVLTLFTAAGALSIIAAAPAEANDAWGTPELAASSWGSSFLPVGNGVAVYSNGPYGYVSGEYNHITVNGQSVNVGMEWQCVELAQRLYTVEGWHSGIFPNVGVAADIWASAGTSVSNGGMGMTEEANNSVTSIVPGDMIVHGTGDTYSPGAGHVAIVDHVSTDGKTIYAVQQNAPDTTTYQLNNGTLTGGSGTDILGVVHSPDNHSTNSAGGGGTSTNHPGNLALNADFGSGSQVWQEATPGSNFVTFTSNQLGSEPYYSSYSGVRYASTNAADAGGGIYQDIPLTITGNETFCATAEVRTSGGQSGAGGIFTLWQLGGGYNDNESVSFGPLTDQWQQIETCGVATTSHTDLRVQFYVDTNGPTLDIDDVDVNQSLALNADFGSGSQAWQIYPGTNSNLATYASNSLGSASYYSSFSGVQYASTNTADSGGGIFQDVPLMISPNETFCATAEVRTSGGQSGAGGTFALNQLNSNGSTGDSESVAFGPLGDQWQQIETCGVATSSHVALRVQFYPTPNGPTLDVDDVDVTQSLALNADFGSGSQAWQPYPGTNSNFATYASGQLGSEPYFSSFSGVRYASMNTSAPGGGIYQDIPLTITGNETFCATAEVRTSGGQSGAGGTFALNQLNADGSTGDSESVALGSLTDQWQQIEDCGVATSSRVVLRVQFYPMPNGPTLDVDDVNVN
jgi:CHAP domain